MEIQNEWRLIERWVLFMIEFRIFFLFSEQCSSRCWLVFSYGVSVHTLWGSWNRHKIVHQSMQYMLWNFQLHLLAISQIPSPMQIYLSSLPKDNIYNLLVLYRICQPLDILYLLILLLMVTSIMKPCNSNHHPLGKKTRCCFCFVIVTLTTKQNFSEKYIMFWQDSLSCWLGAEWIIPACRFLFHAFARFCDVHI